MGQTLYLTHGMVRSCLSPWNDLREQNPKLVKVETQLHPSFMQDVGNSFQIFLSELDIYVKLMVMRAG